MPAAPPEIGPYRVLRPLGRGGMGTVLLAEDSRLGRLVALKTFTGSEARSEYAREQLLREARAAAALSHPNIAAVHDVLDVGGQVVIVFEYVQGETLASRIATGRLSVPTALAIALQLAEGLGCAHEHGVIHRDLKPSNVVITADGLVKVLDFGIARVLPLDSTTDATRGRTTSAFVGTIGYAAPEQCLGQPVDARADVFSLGVVLFEMLTGFRPFPGADATTVVRAMLHGEPPHLPVSVPGAPRALDTATRRALCADPARRPQTARAFGDELRAAVPGATKSPPVLSSKGRVWASAALLAVATLTGGLVSSLLSTRAAEPAVKPPVVAVMPLTNASGDASKDFLALGVAESLITRLAALPSITVLSRSAVADARGRHADLTALARELGATYLVDGSVQQAESQLSINLNLLEPDGSVVWAETTQGPFEKIFDLQTRLASALTAGLQVQLSAADRASLAQQATMNPDALAAYWQGRALVERRDVKGNVDAAVAAFDQAVRLDPRFATAHAARGEALWARYTETKDASAAQDAITAGTTALRLDPNRATVRYSLALSLAGIGRLDEAIEELQRALALQPNYDDARRELGNVLARQGKVDEAVVELEKAIALRPNYWGHYSALGVRLFQAGRYSEAVEPLARVIELQPDNFLGYQQLGTVYQALGRDSEALANYDRATAIRPSPGAYSNIGTLHYRRGEYAKAAEAYRAAIKLRPNNPVSHGNLGDALRRLGRTADARLAYTEAVRLAEAELKVNPNDAGTLAALAMYSAKAGDAVAGQRHLAAAQRIAPDDVEVLFNAAVVYAISQQTDDALSALERAVKGGYRRSLVAETDEFQRFKALPRFQALVDSQSPSGGPTR